MNDLFELRRSYRHVGLYLFGKDNSPLVAKHRDTDLPSAAANLRYSLRLPFSPYTPQSIRLHNLTSGDSTNDCEGVISTEQRANKPASFKGVVTFSRVNLPIPRTHKLNLYWRPSYDSPVLAEFTVVTNATSHQWEIVEAKGVETLYDVIRYETFLQSPWGVMAHGSGVTGV